VGGRLLVFVSSTSDLAAEREAVAAALRPWCDSYLFEEDRARRQSPEEECRRMIDGADVFLGVLGTSYGSPFPSRGEERSIVEWEFDIARARQDLDIMTFVKQEATAGGAEPRQQRFLDRLRDFRQGLWWKAFATRGDLVRLVRESLEGWLVEFWAQLKEAQHHVTRRAGRRLTAIAGAAIVLVMGVTLTPLRSLLSSASVLAVTAAGGSVALLCLALHLAELGGRHD